MVVVLLAGAVGVYAILPRGADTVAGSPSDLSPYDQLQAQVGPNGEVTKDMALQAFALAIAPLPGVTVPTGAPPNQAEQADATFAVLWILPYLDQLTSDQRAVVESVRTPDPSAPSITPQPVGAFDTRVVFAASKTGSEYLDMAEKYETQIAGELGRQLTTTVTMQVDASQVAGHDEWFAYSAPTDDWSTCAIHVEPKLQNEGTSADQSATMAHEMFHCFQFDWARQHGFVMSKDNTPDWITEGSAEWVGELLGGPSPTGDYWWDKYLEHFGTSLFRRGYDAVGFYQHMAEEGINPWHQFDNILAAYAQSLSPATAFVASSANDNSFMDTWSSGGFRDQSLGQAWNASAPWNSSKMPERDDATVTSGGTATASAAELGEQEDDATNKLVVVNVQADIVDVEPTGHVRLRASQLDEAVSSPLWLCFDTNSCQCPPGQVYEGPQLESVNPGDGTADLGLTGGLDGAKASLTGYETRKFCVDTPSQQPNQCSVSCPRSNGDPHLRTVNRYVYDFQAAGEFTLLRSPDSSIEIQARQEPWATANFSAVSINSAIAARVNGHKVSVYATDSGMQLHIDGQPVDPASAPDLGGGAAIKPIKNGIEVDFPDGTVLWTLSVGRWGINAVIQPSDALKSGGRGLMGPITPGGLGVPALPDGTQLPVAPDFATRHNIVYGQFADAWRVTDQSTLFDYDPGKSTESYTDRSFPTVANDQLLDNAIASPDPNQRAAAQQACASVTDADLLSDCTFDVTATGDAGFAQQYTIEQDFYDNGVATQTAPPASPGGVVGATEVTELSHLQSATIGPDGTVYVSIVNSSKQPQLTAIDPSTGAVKQQTAMAVETAIHFAAGSVWASGQATDANGQHCSVTRYDAQTLAKQGDYPIPCTNFDPPHLSSMGDAVWFIDTTRSDPNTGAGTMLTRIDPTTNAPGTSVPLGDATGCCLDSQGAVFCHCGNSDVWRLTVNDAAFVDLGNFGYSSIFAAGTGFWSEQSDNAVFVDAPGPPSASVPLGGGRVVGGDTTGVYLQGANVQVGSMSIPLQRYPADGSAPVTLASAPTVGSGIDETQFDYLTEGFPWFATGQGYIHLWEFKETADSHDALWVQWAPLP